MFKVTTKEGEIGFTFTHYRDLKLKFANRQASDVTTCRVVTPEGKSVLGVSICSIEDKFNKDLGRRTALQRALTASGLDRKMRAAVWYRYWDRDLTNTEYNGSVEQGTLTAVH